MPGKESFEQFDSVEPWLEKCALLLLPSGNHPLVHQHRQLKANQIPGARKRHPLATRPLHICALGPAGAVGSDTPQLNQV